MTGYFRIRSFVLASLLLGAGGASAQETPFGEAGEWAITATLTGETLAHCTASRQIDGRGVYMRFDGNDWAFAVQAGDPDSLFESFDIDGKAYPVDGGRADEFAYVSLDQIGLEAVRNGSLATLDIDGGPIEIPLNGTGAAALRVQDCVREDGVPPAPAEFLVDPGPPVAETGPLGTDCPDRANAASTWDGTDATVTLIAANDLPPLQLFWVDPFGRLLPVPVLLGDEDGELTLTAYSGQSFIARDASEICHGGLIRVQASGGAVEIP